MTKIGPSMTILNLSSKILSLLVIGTSVGSSVGSSTGGGTKSGGGAGVGACSWPYAEETGMRSLEINISAAKIWIDGAMASCRETCF